MKQVIILYLIILTIICAGMWWMNHEIDLQVKQTQIMRESEQY